MASPRGEDEAWRALDILLANYLLVERWEASATFLVECARDPTIDPSLASRLAALLAEARAIKRAIREELGPDGIPDMCRRTEGHACSSSPQSPLALFQTKRYRFEGKASRN